MLLMPSSCRKRPHTRFQGLFLLLAAAMLPFPALGAFSQDLRLEPQPYRQGQILQGRSFNYNAESFMHRASFAPPVPVSAKVIPRDRITGTGGSSRTDELFVDMAVQTTRSFDEGVHLQYRFRRSEDFDGRYDRNLVGLGYRFSPQLSARLMADVVGDKSRIDLQPEISWQPDPRLEIQAALVLADNLFNSKQDNDRFESSPLTGYLALGWQFHPSHRLRGYANITPRTSLILGESQRRFREQSSRGGAAWDWQISPGRQLQWLAEGESTNRNANDLGQGTDAVMDRRYWRSRVAYHRRQDGVGKLRLGGQFLFLRERGNFVGDQQELTDRRENMVFAGTGWRLSEYWLFEPTAFVTHVEGESLKREEQDEGPEDLDGVYGKVALPLIWQPRGPEGPVLHLNPTLRLHTAAFGGGNLSLHIPL